MQGVKQCADEVCALQIAKLKRMQRHVVARTIDGFAVKSAIALLLAKVTKPKVRKGVVILEERLVLQKAKARLGITAEFSRLKMSMLSVYILTQIFAMRKLKMYMTNYLVKHLKNTMQSKLARIEKSQTIMKK